MKLCVTGSFGGGDIGDDAMLTCWLAVLTQMGIKRQDIWLVGHRADYMSHYFQHPANRCLQCNMFPSDFQVADTTCLLVTGGGTINTRNAKGSSLRRMQRLVMPFAHAGVPIFMSGQTVGPLGKHADHDIIARRLVEAVDVLTTRDTIHSSAFLRTIGAKPKQLILTTDDASGLPFEQAVLPKPFERLLALKPAVAAVNVTDYTSDTAEKLAFMAEAVKELRSSGYSVVLVPHYPKDVKAHTRIAQLVGADDGVLVLNENEADWTAEKSKKLISRCALALGGRYHFVVFAVTAGVPCVGMNGNEYSYVKQHGFMTDAGIGEHALTPAQTFDRAALKAKITQVLHAKPATPHQSASFAVFQDWFATLNEKD